MTFRAPTAVLTQPIQWLVSCQSVFSAVAAAIGRLRPSRSIRVNTSPVSATWLADLRRHSTRYRDY